MGKINEYLKTKRTGFYFIFATFVLTLFTLIVFLAGYNASFMSWASFGLMLALLVGDVVLLAFKKDNFVPALNAICSGLALAFFINACYGYVAAVMTGIDIETFSGEWIMSVIGYVASFALSIASIFIPVVKEDKEAVEENA